MIQSVKKYSAIILPFLGIMLLIGLTRHVSWGEVRKALAGIDFFWILGAVFLTIISITLRAFRLYWILSRRISWPQVWISVCLAYFSGLLLPFGGAEVFKVVLIRRQSKLSLMQVGISCLFDRTLDIFFLLVMLVIAFGPGVFHELNRGMMFLLIAMIASAIGFLLALIFGGNWMRCWLDQLVSKYPRWSKWLPKFDEIHAQMFRLRSSAHVLSVLFIQLVIFVVDVSASGCCLRAFSVGEHLPYLAAVRMAGFVMLGFAIPLLPGGLGAHQAAVVLALSPFSIGTPAALAVSLIGELVHFFVLISLGFIALFLSGLGWSEFKRRLR